MTCIEDLPAVMFVTGIGTDVGKSYATGWLAREIAKTGKSVCTQKFIQTGNHDTSEDIAVHRRVMGIPMLDVDTDHTTAPIILSYPASPHLAEQIDGVEVDYSLAAKATETLSEKYDYLLVEGAGGALVPLRGDYLTADYIAEQGLPAVVVTNGQLGSISHTLLTLEALSARGIKTVAVIYNPYFDKDEIISADNRKYIGSYLSKHYPEALYLQMPEQL